MQNYIATFYSDFGALTFCKGLQNLSVKAELMPTPRKLSSSCGVCVGFLHNNQDFALAQAKKATELEGLYEASPQNQFKTLLKT